MVTKNLMDRVVLPKYDFCGMLIKQAEVTAAGIATLGKWLEEPSPENRQHLMELVDEADGVRLTMEDTLMQSFFTPFDWRDMYVFSARLDCILELAKSTVLAVEAYTIAANPLFIAMVRSLEEGIATIAQALAMLATNIAQAGEWVKKVRQASATVDAYYRAALAQLFAGNDAMEALKYREVYNEVKAAAEYMELTIDVFHKIIVRLAWSKAHGNLAK